MSEPKYKKGDKVWTVNGEGGIVYGVKLNSDNFRDRWYSVTLTAPNLRSGSSVRRGRCVYYREPDLKERNVGNV
jgi:hypothetical protein